jgi:hypothetical protein
MTAVIFYNVFPGRQRHHQSRRSEAVLRHQVQEHGQAGFEVLLRKLRNKSGECVAVTISQTSICRVTAFIFFVTYEWANSIKLHYNKLERLAGVNTPAYWVHS